MKRFILIFVAITLLVSNQSTARAESSADSTDSAKPPHWTPTREIKMYGRDVSGPRIGLTYISVRSDKMQESLDKYDLDPLLFQVGWHFEWMAYEPGDAPAVFVEFIPLVGGLEYGLFIPSLSLAMGIRTVSGFEIGVGPNLSPSGASLIIGVGHNFGKGGISLPINLAIATNRDAVRVTVLVGYGINWGKRG